VTVLLKELGRRYRVARRAVRMKHVDHANPFGEPLAEFHAEQIINDWLYGGQFHTDGARGARDGLVEDDVRVGRGRVRQRHRRRDVGVAPDRPWCPRLRGRCRGLTSTHRAADVSRRLQSSGYPKEIWRSSA
jgi:hypothetical protein